MEGAVRRHVGVGGGIGEHAALRAGRCSRPASAPMPSRRYVHPRRRTTRRDGARGDDNVVFENRVVDDDARASPPRREEARQREVDADALPTTTSACQHHEQEQRRQRYSDLFRSPPHEVAAGAAAGAASPRRWRRALAAALMTGACAVAQLCHPAAAARAKSAASAPVDLHTPAASFNLPVPPSADFKLTEFEFDLPEPERRKLATPPHRRQRKKMNAFVREAAERVGPCVVRIDVDFGGGRGGGGGAWRGHGQGCGLVFDSDAGLVITNAHVVEGKGRVVVTFTDGRVYGGCVMGSDALTDIALVRIEPRPDHTLPRVPPVGDSSTLEVGDWVIALGNPFGLDNTITLGIISNLHRTSAELGIPDRRVDFLQTDCAINPGNSGGPLVNEFGEVVAINTAIRADAEGIGFAIPINDVQRVVKLLAAGQRVQHPFIGIQMVTLAPRAHLAGAGETSGSGGGSGGVRSESAGAGSARGGGAGDDDVSDALDAKAGAAASSPEASSSSSSSAAAAAAAAAAARAGAGSPAAAAESLPLFAFPPRRGVLIVKVLPDSPASLAGLRVGDVCVAMQGHPLWDAAQVQKEVNAAKPGQPLSLTILREGGPVELTLRTVDLAPIAKSRGFVGSGVFGGLGGGNYNDDTYDDSGGGGVCGGGGGGGVVHHGREKVASPPGMGLYPRSYGDVGGERHGPGTGTGRGTRDA